MVKQAGFGGGCHWCTEAVFSSLKGVDTVKQGWIAATGTNNWLSEAVLVTFNDEIIPFETLIAVHLYTHSSTSVHSMRGKYRSAVYVFNHEDSTIAQNAITAIQTEFNKPLITQVLPFNKFEQSRDELLNYYYSNPEKPFCENYINPKLKVIMKKFSGVANNKKLKHL